MSNSPDHATAPQAETVRVHCPIRGVIEVAAPELEQIAPLAAHLRANRTVAAQMPFERGTITTDGRLDLCKQHLGARGCGLITDALAHNTIITSLLLGTDGIGDAGAAHVADLITRNAHLEVVYLGCNFIGERGVSRLADALSANTSVTGLWLKRNPIGTGGAFALAAMLRRNQTLRVLDLVNTVPGEEGMNAILDALMDDNRSVERLYLGGNYLTAQIAPRLALLLQRNPALRALLLGVNNLGDAGAALLADGLAANQTLQELGLASNDIGAQGCGALMQAAQPHPALTTLDLGYGASTRILGAQPNHIGDEGASAIGATLAQNPVLRRLNLHRCGVSETGRIALRAGLEHNTHLVSLALDGKPDPHIAALLARNQARQTENSWLSDLEEEPRDVRLIRSVYRA